MEKRLTSSNKRIVEFCGLMESEDLLKFIGRNQSVLETSSWGGKGIDQEKTRQLLNVYLEPFQFEITKDFSNILNYLLPVRLEKQHTPNLINSVYLLS